MLLDLPPEILDHIIGSRDSSFVVINLWKCGNHLLQKKLASGLTYVHLEGSKFFPSLFPLLLCNLRALRYLSVSSPENLMKSVIGWKAVRSQLSSTLETLRLASHDSEHAFFNFAPGTDEDDPEAIDTQYPRGVSRFIDMEKLFPRLQTLDFGGSSCLQFGDAAALPSTLTHLCVGTFFLDYTDEAGAPDKRLVSALPKSLKSLGASVQLRVGWKGTIGDNEEAIARLHKDWSEVPPQLDYLRTCTITPPEPDLDLSWLPKKLKGALTLAPQYSFSPERKTILSLPTQLEELSISNLPSSYGQDWVADLPKHLTKLTLSPHRSLLGAVVTHLPRSLTSLTSHQRLFEWSEIESAMESCGEGKFWPPNLETLLLPSESLAVEYIRLLPKTLKMLSVTVSDPRDRHTDQTPLKIDGRAFPPHLENLTLEFADYVGQFVPINLEHSLPPTLTSLSWKGFLEFEFETIGRNLPAALKSLSIAEVKIKNGHTALLLPPGLTQFECYEWCDGWFSALPRTLTDFKIGSLYKGMEPNFSADIASFEGLPASLTSFTVFKCTAIFDPPPSHLDHLVNLKHLSMDRLQNTPSRVLRVLPRGLEKLVIGINEIDAADAPFIPPALRMVLFGPNAFVAPQYWPLRANAHKWTLGQESILQERRSAAASGYAPISR